MNLFENCLLYPDEIPEPEEKPRYRIPDTDALCFSGSSCIVMPNIPQQGVFLTRTAFVPSGTKVTLKF